MNFDKLLNDMKPQKPKTLAIASAEDDTVLKAICKAYELGFINPILCGNKEKIEEISKSLKLDISKFEIINSTSNAESAKIAVKLVREKKADILMKGNLQTAELLKAVLNKEEGIRDSGTISHVSVLKSPDFSKTFILTDVAFVMYPDLKTKVELINNAVKLAKNMGISKPKVAPICAVETVNPDMPATLDAANLTVMNQRGQIKDCIIDGPLAFDLAVSVNAVIHKGIKSEVAGHADILLFPNIESANSTLKALTNLGGYLFGGLVVGAIAPIVITSRSDTEESKLYSIALATQQ